MWPIYYRVIVIAKFCQSLALNISVIFFVAFTLLWQATLWLENMTEPNIPLTFDHIVLHWRRRFDVALKVISKSELRCGVGAGWRRLLDCKK
jgi:hypothetical protein